MIKSHIRKLSAYKPPLEGRNPGVSVLLDFNERTVGIPERIREALINFINEDRLQVYPEYMDFVEKLAKYVESPAENLMITNGSDHGIELIFRATTCQGDRVIIPEPTFAIFKQIANVENLEVISPSYIKKELSSLVYDLSYPVNDVVKEIEEKGIALIVICSPNNPTGSTLDLKEIKKILEATKDKVAVLLDECYFEYSQITAKDLVDEYKNLFITRTFSKTWGLSSLRLGYIISSKENIEDLKKVRGPYDMNRLAVVAAESALADPSYVASYVKEIMNESKPRLEKFLEENNISYIKSKANFILCFPKDSETIEEKLRAKGILTRPRSGNLINDSLRITLGTKEQMDLLIQALKEIL